MVPLNSPSVSDSSCVISRELSVGARTSGMPMIDRFQEDPDIFIFLISTMAGGTGLNLTAANKVVIFGECVFLRMWINIMIWCRRQTRTGVRCGYCLERELHDLHERPQIRPMTCKLWIERIVSDRHGTFPYTGCSAPARSRSLSMLAKCTSSSRCKWGTTPAYRRGALVLFVGYCHY